MSRTAKQAEASRLNGAKSRGPKTLAGKEASKVNAVKHGGYCKNVVPAFQQDLYHERMKTWANPDAPYDHPREFDVLDQTVRASLRRDSIQGVMGVRDQRRYDRAVDFVEKAETQAFQKSRDLLITAPQEALDQLAETSEGAAFLAESWHDLLTVMQQWGPTRPFKDTELVRIATLLGIKAGDDEPRWKLFLEEFGGTPSESDVAELFFEGRSRMIELANRIEALRKAEEERKAQDVMLKSLDVSKKGKALSEMNGRACRQVNRGFAFLRQCYQDRKRDIDRDARLQARMQANALALGTLAGKAAKAKATSSAPSPTPRPETPLAPGREPSRNAPVDAFRKAGEVHDSVVTLRPDGGPGPIRGNEPGASSQVHAVSGDRTSSGLAGNAPAGASTRPSAPGSSAHG
jgi:hypothetical protein